MTLACALLASPAVADTSNVEGTFDGKVYLDWSATEAAARCITPDQTIADVDSTLGRPVFAPRDGADRILRVDVQAAGSPARYVGRIVLLSANGNSLGARELVVESDDCQEVTTAFTLALSLMADLPRTSDEVAAMQAKSERRGRPPAGRSPSPTVSPAAPARWHVTGGVGPTMALDSNGNVAPGAQLGMVVTPPRFLPLSFDLVTSPRSGSTPAGARYTLLGTTAAAGICAPPWARGRFVWLSCLGPSVTVHVGWGDGFTDSRSGASSTVGGMLQNHAAYSLTRRWRVVLGIAVTATPQRVPLAFSGKQNPSTTFYRTPILTTFTTIGVAADFF